jgi:TPP-dependent trihydroxycyclohexane-1,2-dione (THcHDO) dehydratase
VITTVRLTVGQAVVRFLAANELAARADVVTGIGTRWTDFTTASRTVFAEPGGRFVNLNVAAFDAAKQSGVDVLRTHSIEEFRQALAKARAADQTTLVYIATDPPAAAPASEAWWDVPVAEVAELATTRDARVAHDQAKERQRPYL